MQVIWESVPDRELEEHLRRVFEILLKPATDSFDGGDHGRQDESTGQGQASNQILPR